MLFRIYHTGSCCKFCTFTISEISYRLQHFTWKHCPDINLLFLYPAFGRFILCQVRRQNWIQSMYCCFWSMFGCRTHWSGIFTGNTPFSIYRYYHKRNLISNRKRPDRGFRKSHCGGMSIWEQGGYYESSTFLLLLGSSWNHTCFDSFLSAVWNWQLEMACCYFCADPCC